MKYFWHVELKRVPNQTKPRSNALSAIVDENWLNMAEPFLIKFNPVKLVTVLPDEDMVPWLDFIQKYDYKVHPI